MRLEVEDGRAVDEVEAAHAERPPLAVAVWRPGDESLCPGLAEVCEHDDVRDAVEVDESRRVRLVEDDPTRRVRAVADLVGVVVRRPACSRSRSRSVVSARETAWHAVVDVRDEVLSRLAPGLVALDHRVPVRVTGDDGNGAVGDGHHRLVRPTGREPTARTPETARRVVVEEVRGVLGRQPAGPGEPREMLRTADQRDPQGVEQQERGRVGSAGAERRPTRVTGDGRERVAVG